MFHQKYRFFPARFIRNGILAVALLTLAFAPLNVAHSASSNSHSINSTQLTLADLPSEAQAAISTALQRAKLTVSNGKASDYLGDSVAISTDGNTIVVGAQNSSTYTPSTHEGVAYVFVKPGDGWSVTSSYTALLANSAGAESGDLFGWFVAISADGNTIVVGAPFGGYVTNHGEAHVFVKPGGGWGSTGYPMYQTATLTASDGATNDYFGDSVAISGDGQTVVVGAPGHDINANVDQGSAYLFYKGGGWANMTENVKLTAFDGLANDQFGGAVSINSAGGVVVVGASWDDIGANTDQGSAYVFAWSPPFWAQSAKLTASDGLANDEFGNSVSISGDGGVVVVGAHKAPFGLAPNVGTAYVFVAPLLGWTDMTETTELGTVDWAHDDYFGESVAISADGNSVIVGAFYGGSIDQGAAYLFTKPGGGWAGVLAQPSKLTASDGAANDRFGNSVSISGDGVTIAIGAPWSDIGANADQGSAYVFVQPVDTTATITSDNPDPSVVGQSVVVSYTVTSTGGTPTDNVTVSDGVDSCTDTVAAGTCSITLTTAGARTLTATYAGNANFNGSSDTEPHQVNYGLSLPLILR